MPDNLQTFIEAASVRIEGIFKRTGRIYPMYHAITRAGEPLIVPAPTDDKDTNVMLTRALFELKDVVQYVYVDEAWRLDASRDKFTPELAAKVMQAYKTGLADHPDLYPEREEIVCFSAEGTDAGQLMAARKIIRPAKGRAYLGPLEFDPRGGAMEGRMVGLLPKPKGKEGTLQ